MRIEPRQLDPKQRSRLAFALAASIPWAITEDGLTTILEVANRENLSPEAVETQLGRPLENSQVVTTREGVAIIPIAGPIFRHANLFSRISGASSIDILARDLRAAIENPAVTAIMLNIDSPGGEVNGTHEFAEMIFSARGSKPITAYVGGAGASAAYWIASAADEVVADATARIGSIGIVQAVANPKAESIADIQIVSSQSPRKRPDVSTESGRAVIQETIDAVADVFVDDVAKFRGTDRETVLADFGKGGILIGESAKRAGMVDAIGSYEGTITALRQRAARAQEEKRMRLVNRALGLAEEASEETAVASIEKLKGEHREMLTATGAKTPTEAIVAIDALKLAKEQLGEQKAEIEKLRQQAHRAEVEAYLDGPEARTRVEPKDREKLIRLGMRSLEEMKDLVGMLPERPGAPSGRRIEALGLDASDPAMSSLSEGDREFVHANGIDPKQFAKFKADKLARAAKERRNG